MWVLFYVPCPTPDAQTSHDLFQKRFAAITESMKASAVDHGCRFHRAWYSEDDSAFYALANWDSAEGAGAFFEQWEIRDEPGEVSILLQGDVGLVPKP